MQYNKDGTYRVSSDEGKTWHDVKAELLEENNRSVLKCSIDLAKYKCNVFRTDSSLLLFDQVRKYTYHISRNINSTQNYGFESTVDVILLIVSDTII